jgi:hypothetical protein
MMAAEPQPNLIRGVLITLAIGGAMVCRCDWRMPVAEMKCPVTTRCTAPHHYY